MEIRLGRMRNDKSRTRDSQAWFLLVFWWLLSPCLCLNPLENIPTCNRSRSHITNSTWGVISDGHGNYTQDSHCEWLIQAENPSSIITLLIHTLKTECSYDYLFIFDGKSYRDAKLLASLSGATKPLQPFVANSGYLLVVLYSDTNYVLEGFVAEYFVTPCSIHCPNLPSCTGQTPCACVQEVILDPFSNETRCTSPEFSQSQSTQYSTSSALRRVGHSALRHGSRLFIYGGFDLNLILNDLIVLDLTDSSYTKYTEVKSGHTNSWPSTGHFGHAAVSYGQGFFIHGGRTPDGISGDLHFFNVTSGYWLNFTNNRLPRLIYHTLTEGPSGTFYVYGGGSPSGAFSNRLYRFSGTDPGTWDLIETHCCGKEKERTILGHTMNYWPKKNVLILFGGLVADVGRFSKLSTQLWIFLISSNQWIPIEYRRPPTEQNTERAFATSLILGDHLVVVGGYSHTHNRDETCYANHILVYNLECYVLVPEVPLGESLEGLFGHQAILWEQKLLVVGGYRGYLNGKVSSIPLSLTTGNSTECRSFDRRWRCVSERKCGWCPTDDRCYEKLTGSKNCTTNLQTAQCPGLCTLLKTCSACAALSCSWCEWTEQCFSAEDGPNGYAHPCPDKYLRNNVTDCVQLNVRHALTILEYRNPLNLLHPDAVRTLNASLFHLPKESRPVESTPSVSSNEVVMLNVRGFLVEAPSPLERLELCVYHCLASLRMEQGPESDRESLTLSVEWTPHDQTCTNLSWSSGLPVSLLPGAKISVDLNVTNGVGHEKVGRVMLRHNLKPFRKENLLSYSSSGTACSSFRTCLHCLGDTSCLWLNANATCAPRSLWSINSAISVTLVLEECSVCSDFTSCASCTDPRQDCEWREDDATCARWGKNLSSITTTAECSPDCHFRQNCSTCLDPAGACVWCAQTQECFVFSVYTSFFQYGQCIQWKDKKAQCTDCQNQTTCDKCVSYMGCGWSYRGDEGTCTEGDFGGPYAKASMDLVATNSSWAYLDCPDVDECSLKLHDCHKEALCINTQGSYTCQCRQGFTGDGKLGCYQTCFEPCVHGRCTESFECQCDLGWTGVDCSIDCGCHNHSSCDNGACDKCEDYTQGDHCEQCAPASYGNATVEGQGCRPCQCNDHGDPDRGLCNRTSGDCFCLHHTTGRYCSKCISGYYGSPADGKPCFKECGGRGLMNSTVGYFGLEGKLDPRGTMDHCMWIISPPSANRIRIRISPDYQIPCAENALKVYAGLPSFSTQNRNALLLASICSYPGEFSREAITVDVEGSLATVLLQHPRAGHHRAKFNATYALMQEDLLPSPRSTSQRPTSSQSIPLPVKSLSNGKSVLSRFGFTLFSDEKNVFIFGGYSFSHGVLNDVRQFRRDVEQWVPLTITVVQNEDSVPLGRYFHAGALGPNSEIFIHGGMTQSTFLSDTWRFDTRLSRWKRLFRESSRTNSLRLAGHTLTLRHLEAEGVCQLVIIGGMNPWSGFSNKVYVSTCVEPIANWEPVNTTGTSPIGIYGHTTVYHRGSDTFYVFGGIVYERDEVNISPTLFALHWPTKRWTLLPPNQDNQVHPLPSPRFLHGAISMDSYMIVVGGSGSPKTLMAYVYACNLWMRVGTEQMVETSGGGVAISDQQLLLMGGWDGSSAIESLSSVGLPRDLCSIQRRDEDLCKATLGCSYCSSDKNQSQCYTSTLEMPSECSSGASKRLPIEFWRGQTCSTQWMSSRNCTHYQTCSDCLATWPIHPNASQACQWCTNCQIGRCVPAGKKCPDETTCGQKQRETSDSILCPERQCSASECEKCVGPGKCIWTRQILRSSEWSFQLHSQPVYNWNCVRKSILDTKPSFSVSSSPPDKCPNPCISHATCADCLDSPGSEGGFQECHWSVTLNTCLSPAHKFIRCFGGVCGPILRGQSTNCPKTCSSHTSCSTCLESPYCGWCSSEGRNGEGRCVSGSSASADAEECGASNWNYLSCPKENECLNGHHKCDTESENCIDLDEGHACLCREGYKKYRETCIPICDEGCVHGDCTAPNKCTCHFGFVGSNCSAECNCNGHSHCAGDQQLDTCLKCMNNTMGPQCTRCLPLFIGDPKNGGTCVPCNEYCNGHSDVCLSWTLHQKWCNGSSDLSQAQLLARLAEEEDEPGPLTTAYCCTCKHHTANSKCDDCIPGYFRGTEDKRQNCRKCECHGHGNHCDSVTGENCNCHNNTESDHCPGSSKGHGQQCWKQQCSKCREYYLGVPTNGHQCYRQMHVDSEYYCFNDSQDSCAKPKPLLSGRTVFFAVQPKFMNVNIRINLDVTHGSVHVYLSPKEDTFVIRQDVNTWTHVVRYDMKYGLTGDTFDGVSQNYIPTNLTDVGMSLKSVFPESYRKEELEAAGFTTHVTLTDPKSVLVVRNLRNRLVITLPQESHELKTTRFYIVMEGIGDVSYGNIFFRQDQLHIDLFVFFSVFFSAFFLFLAACGIAWKFKQNLESRRARQRQMQMAKQMAKRPFAIWTLILEPETTSPLYEIYAQCRKSCRKGCICLRPVAVEPIRDGSAAICTMFVTLPGGPMAPCRLALASSLANNLQSYSTHVRRRRL